MTVINQICDSSFQLYDQFVVFTAELKAARSMEKTDPQLANDYQMGNADAVHHTRISRDFIESEFQTNGTWN